MQRAAIEKAAEARGDSIGEWYAEKRTASTGDRPELQRLMRDVDAGRRRRVYVFRLDRLTRMGIADTLAVVKRWRDQGVELVNLADGFSVPAPGVEGSAARIADLILAILGCAAEMELLTRRERIAARRELAEASGESWGRPSRLTEKERGEIRRRVAAGESVRGIARALKIPKSIVGRVPKAALSRNPPLGTGVRKARKAGGQ
jgi:putative DNA-invertase from lambdoid prophage Rac